MDNVITVDHPLVQHKLTLMPTSPPPRGLRQLMVRSQPCCATKSPATCPHPDRYRNTHDGMQARELSGRSSCLRRSASRVGLIEGMPTWCVRARGPHRAVCEPRVPGRCRVTSSHHGSGPSGLVIAVDRCSPPATPPSGIDRLKETWRERSAFVCLLATDVGYRESPQSYPEVRI